MKKYLILVILLSEFVYAAEFEAIRIEQGELVWNQFGEGVWKAHISGDASEKGMYVHRIKLAEEVKSDRHYHQDVEVVTVLSGSIYVGFAGKDGEWSMKKPGVGGVYTEPRNQPYFVWTKSEEAVVQVAGYGPTSRELPENSEVRH